MMTLGEVDDKRDGEERMSEKCRKRKTANKAAAKCEGREGLERGDEGEE